MVALPPPMIRTFLFLLTVLCVPSFALTALSPEERGQASALYKKFTTAKDTPAKRTEIVREMVEMGSSVAKVIHPIIDREYRAASARYRSDFFNTAKSIASKKDGADAKERIEKLRAQVRALRSNGGLSKDKIKRFGDPAVAELRKLTRLGTSEILASSEALVKARKHLIELGTQRNACIDALVLIELDEFKTETLAAEEKEIATSALSMDRDSLKILEQNKQLASQIEPAEAVGIADLNELRVLIGLRPCLIDPKLCSASRDHSKDMAAKNFFSHDSPISGKETPWKRAKLSGTSASSENIYMGSPSGKSANKSWWYSPGHHKNMLAPGARRVGMGVSGKRWTQMFGG
ncbi:MAG: hypothetical protein ACI8XO_000714 [Verrucomicrobiales bacterium]|jgi:uncharacterized protein YkwD